MNNIELNNIEFQWIKNNTNEDGKAIRTEVFVEEQGVLSEEEFDGSDSFSENLVLYVNKKAAATGRIVIGERGEGMIGRIACLKEYRGQGLGKVLVEELIRRCGEKGFDTVYIHAQTRVRGFYEKLGFVAYGDMFMEAGILHISMKKTLY